MVIGNDLITITPLAVEKLKGVLEEQSEEGSFVRIIAMPGGNGGMQYMLAMEKEAKDDDLVINADSIQILVDEDSQALVDGASIDYIDGLMRSGFTISNPNFQGDGGACACGGNGCGCGGH